MFFARCSGDGFSRPSFALLRLITIGSPPVLFEELPHQFARVGSFTRMKRRCSVATAPGVVKVKNLVNAHYRFFICEVVLSLEDFDMPTVGRDVGG
jgi:hypothetical protein